VRFFFRKDGPIDEKSVTEEKTNGSEFHLKSTASSIFKAISQILFDLLFGHFVGRNVAATPNEGGDDANVVGLSAIGESSEVHVVDEALT